MRRRRLLVLGGTGGTGREIISQALDSGHEVTAFVRNAGRLEVRHDHLRVLTGDVTEGSADLDAAMGGQDVVVSALGRGKSFQSGGLIARSMPHIVNSMQRQGVRRLIVVSAFGVGVTLRDVPLVPRIFIRLLLKDIYRDKNAGECELRSSELDWTVVYPSGLFDGPASGRYRVGERLSLRGFPRISRADVAHFILSQIDEATYCHKGVMLSA
jgi:putative NADH-flavin reductase